MSKQISVIGCGWLGFPLAKALVTKHYKVKGSTTSKEKIELLFRHKVDGYTIQLTEKGIIGDIKKCLAHSETLILNVPPGLRKNPKSNFAKKMAFLLPYIEASSIKNVILVSSTSVYDDDKTMPIITEQSATSNSKSAQQLLEVEQLFTNSKKINTTILRFSGLYGENRHPATFLSGKIDLKNSNAPVNLIHQKDCIAIIISIIEKEFWNTTFNASTVSNQTKKEHYTSVCIAKKLPIPQFNLSSKSKGKRISSKKLMQDLDYSFQVEL
ncbi:NAD-dependent epimerase/dehydratase family protein [Ichthyenterobacterium magnum]|uniref:Nucleoside-diphosphate-sugar epimerase n=1 Tax=Ichthyenterobacterium magnum TaxID=1230530 RepID=A0A420DXK2_9FLAO|nr:NAD-dependent epimerase/dehydratase family protein [Ichthyenterobacterium magnum]RKE98972.1 nucleoside-diphosphate-sugar epimerase [Ichthyenterobacterium magnum]